MKGVTIGMSITIIEENAQRGLEASKACESVGALDEKLSQEDVNQKLLRSLSPEWNTHAVVWRNKVDLDTMSMDDLYNNLKVYEPKVKGTSSSSSSTQNMAFVQPNSPQLVHEDLEQIHPDDMEEIDLRWKMAMLTMMARRFLKKIGRNLTINDNDTIGFNKFNVKCYNCHKRRHFATEYRAPRNQDNKYKESLRRIMPMETSNSIALVSCVSLGGYEWSYHAEQGPNYALVAFSSLSFDSKVSIDSTCSKSCLKTVKLLKSQNEQLLKDLKKYELMLLGNFMPPTPDLSFTGLDEFANKLAAKNCKAKSSEEETKVVRKNDDALIIEEYVSGNEEENVSQPKIEKKIVRPSIVKKEFVKSKQQEKTVRKTVKQAEKHKQNTHRPRGNKRKWNNMTSQKLENNFKMFNKACYVFGSFDHLQVDCNYIKNSFKIKGWKNVFGTMLKG
nr:hypothetical protein [Tanacetum cinerariifolium]